MKISYITIPLAVLLMAGCTDKETTSSPSEQTEQVAKQDDTTTQKTDAKKDSDQQSEKTADTSTVTQSKDTNPSTESKTTTPQDSFTGYKKITVDGGDLSGSRQANVSSTSGSVTGSTGRSRMNTVSWSASSRRKSSSRMMRRKTSRVTDATTRTRRRCLA